MISVTSSDLCFILTRTPGRVIWLSDLVVNSTDGSWGYFMGKRSAGVYLDEVETMKPGDVKRLQDERLRVLASYVAGNSPYYKNRLVNEKLVLDSVASREDLQELPFTTKEDMRAFPFEFRATADRVHYVFCSGGTTGHPKIFFYTADDFRRACEIAARSFWTCGIRASDRVAIVQPFGIWSVGIVQSGGLNLVGATVVPIGLYMSDEDTVGLIEQLKCTAISAAPSNICRLTEFILDRGLTPSTSMTVRKLIVSGEAITDNQRSFLTNAWGAEIFSLYGTAETDILGVECTEHRGIHIWVDQFLIEVIDPETEAELEPASTGELVVTTLTRFGTPLLRYRLGDLVELSGAECGCGRTHPLLTIKGRVDDFVSLQDGTKVYPFQIESVLASVGDDIIGYQVIVDKARGGTDQLVLRVGVKDVRSVQRWKSMLERSLNRLSIDFFDAFSSGLVCPWRLEIVNPSELETTPRGKVVRFIDNRRRHYNLG